MAIYQTVAHEEEPDEIEIDPVPIGDKIGLTPIAIKTILLQLIRANFLKKVDATHVRLTLTGVKVAKSLLEI